MLEVNKRKNYNDLEEFGILTDQGEFIISKEDNNSIYVGYPTDYLKDSSKDDPIVVKITKENYDVYKIFDNLYKRLIAPFEEGEILPTYIISSQDYSFFKGNESSKLYLEKDEDTGTISLIFKKSKSKKCINSYFVKLSGTEHSVSTEFYTIEMLINELKNYSPQHRQIHMEEYLYQASLNSKKDKVRKRMAISSIK